VKPAPGRYFSRRAYAVVETQVQAECIGDLTLKGFHKPVTDFNVLGLTAAEL